MTPTPLAPTLPPGLFPIDAGKVAEFWRGSSFAQFTRFIPDLFDFNTDVLIAKIKLVSFIVSIIFSFIFMSILMKLRRLYSEQAIITAQKASPASSAGASAVVQGPYRARWEEIQKHMDSAKEAEWKFAVIEADKLADLLLQRAGFQGGTMGERLMSIQDGQLLSLQELWDAHKVRNNLAHSVDYFLRYSEAKQAIDKYERFFQELGVL